MACPIRPVNGRLRAVNGKSETLMTSRCVPVRPVCNPMWGSVCSVRIVDLPQSQQAVRQYRKWLVIWWSLILPCLAHMRGEVINLDSDFVPIPHDASRAVAGRKIRDDAELKQAQRELRDCIALVAGAWKHGDGT